MKYTISFDTENAGVSGAFKTLAAIINPDTTGIRARLTGYSIGSADETPFDESVAIEIGRILDVSAGGAGSGFTAIAASAITKNDPAGPIATSTGAVGYGTEPTVYESRAWKRFGINDRGALWSLDEGDKPLIIIPDMLMGIRAGGHGATVLKFSGYLEFENF